MIFNKPYNLKISTQLKVFFLLPWLVILYFGAIQTSQYLDEMNQAQQVSLSIEISLKIDRLIFELQKERGLTEGFLANGDKMKATHCNFLHSVLKLICN